MRRTIAHHLKKANEIKDEKERIKYLQTCEIAQQLEYIFSVTYDPRAVWDLPTGTPPFRKADHHDETTMYRELRKFHIWDANASPNIHRIKREKLFIETLENLHPDDVPIMIGIKDKKMPFENITSGIAKAAFPAIMVGDYTPKESVAVEGN